MKLTPANCTNCQAPLEVVNPAALCAFCNTPYVDNSTAPAHDCKPEFLLTDGVLLRYDGDAAVVVIPNETERIGPAAFAGNERLRHVVIPDSVMEIEADAFADCPLLTHVTLDDNGWNYFFAHFPHSEEGAKRLAWQADGRCTRCGGKIARIRKQCKLCNTSYKET